MLVNPDPRSPILATGEKVFIRDALAKDVEHWVHWRTHGEWQHYDAPWEGIRESLTPNEEYQIRWQFLASCEETKPLVRRNAMIARVDGDMPIGWVNRYQHQRFLGIWYIGVAIAEDACLNQGFGTEAIRLWTGYLFKRLSLHRLALDTWSFNPRMIRCAEKAGYTYEGAQRAMIEWNGQWLDWVHFGILREEFLVSEGEQ